MLRKPKGVIAVITPWNFPFAIPMWLICSAIAEGNTVVFKPSEDTPAVAEYILHFFEQAGLPPGVLNLVQGLGEEAGWPLVQHPDVDVVAFTGSAQVGSQIRQECAKSPYKLAICEMGGKNAVIVLNDANIDLAVNIAILSAFKTSGQRCTSASRLIVHNNLLSRFTKQFIDTAKQLRIGDPTEEITFMGPLINKDAFDKVKYYNNLAKEESSKVLLQSQEFTGVGIDGYSLSPHIYYMEGNLQAKFLQEEVFGPHVAIILFKTLDEAVNIYNSTDYGMAMSVVTENYRSARYLREHCSFGMGYINLPTIGAEVQLPFGGVKKSGTGMPSAATLIDAFTHRVAWTINNSTEIKMAQGLK